MDIEDTANELREAYARGDHRKVMDIWGSKIRNMEEAVELHGMLADVLLDSLRKLTIGSKTA